ncbi:hypothetical protein M1M14_gp165 [Synechococcus phage ACG-2014e]|uniref:Uncharacterized protein n=1 Tax=Synechococcus phage ACG-2014e TaxID=1493510 RepID=A0A0E3HAW5_9CAUD|nr:hypothetical protein AAJ58_gp162 [Synechococcus phage ACG-2014e]YP_010355777.1 hypothetical protein M1M14_gp165 [Synechococcus phage ACG-2014e]AIX20628.1 hypothetical protein Syn7803C85_165 [Synechococcus phage ACG-2014e]AIX29843.1 hypothetical protein Syn7803US33_162 [Synechococcus phage ACG-2014e]AIX45081.1 hypothetical protein Syn7803C2_162 [Synechococcus phage ACG-2014e]
MSMWQKIKSIQIPGSIMAASLTGLLLGTTMVLFTKLPVAPPTVPTSVENTSGKNESLEVIILLASGEELQVRVTGETTMEVVQSLKRILNSMDGSLLLEKSSPYTPHQDESTTRRPASSSFMTF